MDIGIIYFSATGNTAKIGQTMSYKLKDLGMSVCLIDITPFGNREEKIDYEKYDALIFGFPVWGSAIPAICRDWVKTLEGKNKLCSMYFTYGGPTMGIAHYLTKELLNEQGFRVIATAEFPGKHTYNVTKGFNFLEDRPNLEDLKFAEEYAVKLNELFRMKDPKEINIERPEKTDRILELIKNQTKRTLVDPPTRDGKDCSMCRDCELLCPNNAFNADLGYANGDLCLACMCCVTICPDKVIEYRRDMTNVYNKLMDYFNLTDEKLKNLKSKIFI